MLSPPRSGALCKPWKEQIIVEPLEHSEIVGGHNYCRNPAGDEQMEEPWCFTTDRSNPKQVRKIHSHCCWSFRCLFSLSVCQPEGFHSYSYS